MGLRVGVWEVRREETREGGFQMHCVVRDNVWELRESISRDGEESEDGSERARTAWRSNADCWGSQRTESMYLDCGSLWTWGGSRRAVPGIAMVGVYRGFELAVAVRLEWKGETVFEEAVLGGN